MNQSKLTDLTVENILSTGVAVKMQITDLISENLTNSDLESVFNIIHQSFLDLYIHNDDNEENLIRDNCFSTLL